MDVRKPTSFGDIITLMPDKKEQELDWKAAIRSKIENDISNQVKEALDTPPVDRRWVERKKANRQKKLRNLHIMKLNSLHNHAPHPMFSRFSDETSSEKSFKYIDVNYAEKVAALARNHKFDKYTNRSLPGFDFARRNGLFKYGAPIPSGDHSNVRGGLDVTLLDTSPSSINFLTLPKHDFSSSLKPMGGNLGVITFNGISLPNYGPKRRCFQTYSKDGLANILSSRNRRSKLSHIGQGNYVDKRGVVLSKHGPFWPPGYGPVCKCPSFIQDCQKKEEFGPDIDPSLKTQANNVSTAFGRAVMNNLDSKWRPMGNNLNHDRGDGRHFVSNGPTRHHSQSIGEFYGSDHHNENRPRNHYHNERYHHNNREQKPQWRGKPVIYDCERSSRAPLPHAVPDGMSESLIFESRFESGNLRQVRRIGEFEYELVLRTDMYTKRHTQWYYFRVQNAQRSVKYKFNIINLLKKDSLYNYGMKPLVYSEHLASEQNLGWHRMGENIRYLPWSNPTRNGLLSLDMQYYNLEFEITFDWENIEDDSIYLSHCYPYTYSDLKRHLDTIMAEPEQSKHVKREVLCETTAGNACFLLTITEFPDKEKDKYKDFHQEKKGVVVTARVHPGESQASWMMKGVIDFLTSDCYKARQLRKKFVFKIVPMLNPDGVIVGNYRTSLAARDLNRNYRHPRQTTFPTVWHTKQMIDLFSKDHEIVLYCDLHGHSRKPMVFMYGCERKALYNSAKQNSNDESSKRSPRDCAKDFIEERLFPWLMHKRSPDRFSFHGSKYAVRKSKEATGRVVMFRQFGIANSFTMEASFSGTMRKKLDSGRHFNIEDFLSVGRSLCEAVLDYQRVSESPLLKTRVIMDLTKDLAQHMLETNPQAMQTSSAETTNNKETTDAKSEKPRPGKPIKAPSPKQSPPSKRSVALHASGENTEEKTEGRSLKNENKIQTVHRSRVSQKSTQETETSIPGPPEEVQNAEKEEEEEENDEKPSGLDESCFRLLEQMNFQGMAQESDTSSDSDSESDPELPEDAPGSNRQKKKKKRKKRPHYMKAVSAPSSIGLRKQANKDQKPKVNPGFVNRYTHRSNGGIPIYAQERIQERAARRLAEMKLAEEEKVRRQNEIMLGRLDENDIKDEEARARYAEVYGIRYQLGPQPNKPQYTVYNPFQDLPPPSGQGESVYQTPYRIKNDAKLFHIQESSPVEEEGSQDSEGGSQENTARSSHPGPARDDCDVNNDGEEHPEKIPNPQRTAVPLQTLSFKFVGEGKQASSSSLKSFSRDWMTSSYEDKLLSSVRDWNWASSAVNRSRTIDLGANFLQKERTFDERVPRIDIGADFHTNYGEKTRKKTKNPPETISRHSSASPPPHNDPFTPKNITQYEVVIGQMRYPIQIHRSKPDATGPPMVTGESILNQKPSENSGSGHKRQIHRAKSADFGKNSTDSDGSIDQKRYLVRARSFEEGDELEMTQNSDSSRENSAVSSKTNGLVFAVHRVNVVKPKNMDPHRVSPLKSTPCPPKRSTTMFSPIVKPLTPGAALTPRQRAFSVDPDFNMNSAR